MQEILKIINELRQYSGNAQLDYLQANKSELLKQILDYTYNPHKMYKIDELKLAMAPVRKGLLARKFYTEFRLNDWWHFTILLDELAEKRASNIADVRRVNHFITQFKDLDVQQFLSQVLTKDLRLNLGIKKLQTVWPDFCNEPEVQLAEEFKGQLFNHGMYSRKFDGKRMYIMEGVAYSRSNKPCKKAPIQHILDQIPDYLRNVVLDGEILYFDTEGNEDFQKGISLTSSDNRTSECDNLYYVIFDIIEVEHFKNKQEQSPFKEVYKATCELLGAQNSKRFGYSVLDTDIPNVLLARQSTDSSIFITEKNNKKWEGLMYRDGDMPYQFKRTKSLLKIKDMQDGEFTLIDMETGTGRNTNRLGKLTIDFKGNNVGVGSGFTDEDRRIIWDNRGIFNSTPFKATFDVKVQYFEETKDADGKDSLRFPVFLCFRHSYTREELTPEQALEWCRECGK